MTQAFVPSLGSLPMLDALRRERSHGDLPGYLQVVQGIQVLLNYAGVVVTEVEERSLRGSPDARTRGRFHFAMAPATGTHSARDGGLPPAGGREVHGLQAISNSRRRV